MWRRLLSHDLLISEKIKDGLVCTTVVGRNQTWLFGVFFSQLLLMRFNLNVYIYIYTVYVFYQGAVCYTKMIYKLLAPWNAAAPNTNNGLHII